MNVKPFFKGIWRWVRRNSTKILAGGAIASEVLGFWFMHKEAPVVRERLDELPEDANLWQKIKVAGPVYLPAIIMLTTSIGCVIGGCAAGEKKAAIIASLYSASEASLRRLEEKVVKELGPEKAKELHDAAVEELAKQNPPPRPSAIKNTGKGTDLFFDRRTGQWFYSSYNAVKNDAVDFNNYLREKTIMEFNDWLECVGEDRAELAEFFGFDLDHPLQISISGECRTEDGQLYYILDYAGTVPLMYNGKPAVEFRRYEDCFPPLY